MSPKRPRARERHRRRATQDATLFSPLAAARPSVDHSIYIICAAPAHSLISWRVNPCRRRRSLPRDNDMSFVCASIAYVQTYNIYVYIYIHEYNNKVCWRNSPFYGRHTFNHSLCLPTAQRNTITKDRPNICTPTTERAFHTCTTDCSMPPELFLDVLKRFKQNRIWIVKKMWMSVCICLVSNAVFLKINFKFK